MNRTGGRHSAAEVFAASGERRQLFARDTTLPWEAPLVRIEVGQALELRQRARSGQLICPIPECPDPRYTTSGGSRRDHFVHIWIGNGSHTPESWFHYTGKRLVGDWLRETYPDARVVVDEEAVENGQVPDVLAEFPDGRRLAFEVQYAALTLDEWVRRHDGYRSQGIDDVWLLGHTPRYFRQARAEYLAGRLLLGPIAAAMWEASVGPYWINPDNGTVATALRWTDPWCGEMPRRLAPHDVLVGVDPIVDCRIGAKGFRTPVDELDQAAAERIEAERAERDRIIRDAMARREAEAERLREERTRKAAYRVQREECERRDYQAGFRVEVETKCRSAMPILEVQLPHDGGIWRYHAYWHGRFFLECIQDHVGDTFSFNHACRSWMEGGSSRGVFAALSGFLFHLRDHGFVSFESTGYWIDSDIRVLADADCPPAARNSSLAFESARVQARPMSDDPLEAAQYEALERWRRHR